MKDEPNTNGWSQWQNYVLKTLEDVHIQLRQVQEAVVESKVAIGQLNVKAGIWGGVSGLIAAGIALAVAVL